MQETGTKQVNTKSMIRQLIVHTLLYLPFCFFIWFYASSLLIIPVKYLLHAILSMWQADLFNAVTQNQYILTIETLIFPNATFAGQGEKLAVLDVIINPMIYGYGLAVIAALIISIPNIKPIRKIFQVLIGYILVVVIQVVGSFWELLKHLIFTAGPDAQAAILNTGLSANIIALMYQMSYLILPSVVPIAYWIIINNNFISEITGLKSKTARNFEPQQLSEKQE